MTMKVFRNSKIGSYPPTDKVLYILLISSVNEVRTSESEDGKILRLKSSPDINHHSSSNTSTVFGFNTNEEIFLSYWNHNRCPETI